MTDDIKTRLRREDRSQMNWQEIRQDRLEAADRIEALEAAMKQAIRWIDDGLLMAAATELETALGENDD